MTCINVIDPVDLTDQHLMAEHQRLVEMLSDTTNSKYHIFELEIPNPAYEQGKSS